MPITTQGRTSRRRQRLAAATGIVVLGGSLAATLPTEASAAKTTQTTTPISHLVVIFQENVSFDHYFGTYPNTANTDGSPFHAVSRTPTVNGLTGALLAANPNGMNPERLSSSQALTCDQDHGYQNEQLAADHGAMDQFIKYTQKNTCAPPAYGAGAPGLVLNYYDGNTVTGLWNYAQHFAMSDNSYGSTFGPSTPGALNLVSGQTHGAVDHAKGTGAVQTSDTYGAKGVDPKTGVGTVINDPDPFYDKCSSTTNDTVAMTGPNIGDLLNKQGVSWGWFQGGFADCTAKSPVGQFTRGQQSVATTQDYSAHHEPFQYYTSTANPNHLPPVNLAEVGHSGPANHQYDVSLFARALDSGRLPAVSFLKAKKSQDGHPGYSDPLDEQHFLVDTINQIEHSKDWKSTAIVLAYDDSDGWYDHQLAPVVNHSQSIEDALTNPGQCGAGGPKLGGFDYRCGYGPRLPLLVISPFARANSIDNTLTDQSSVLRFIEDNWMTGQIGGGSFDAFAGSLGGMFDFSRSGGRNRPLFLNPRSGQPVSDDDNSARQQG